MHTHKNNCNCKHLEIADSRFTDDGILVTPKSMTAKIISDTHDWA
jgi:hypothetical protein